jgi:formylglycine-generating enzyme required for sulfatase activity
MVQTLGLEREPRWRARRSSAPSHRGSASLDRWPEESFLWVVTKSDMRWVRVATGSCKHKPEDQRWGRGRQPVINVSWDDVTNEYLPWLSRKTGKTYRLLTEGEWEYAARARTTTKYSWGDDGGPMLALSDAGLPHRVRCCPGSRRQLAEAMAD